MDLNMLDILYMGLNPEKDYICGMTVQNMKEIGTIIRLKDLYND